MRWSAGRVKIERGLYRSGDVYWACVTPQGQRRAQWQKLGAVGVQEARRLRDQYAYKLRSGQLAPSTRRVRVREAIGDWEGHLDGLVAAGELRPRTAVSYKGGVTLHFLPSFGSRQISSIGPDDLLAWHEAQRRSGAAAWSIRARWMGVRSLLGYAARTGIIAANPADLLLRRERPKPGRSRDRFLTPNEIHALLAGSEGIASFAVPMLLFSGLRAAELLGLTWKDIGFEARVIRVRMQMSRQGVRTSLKTEEARRDVILMDELARLLRTRRLAARFSTDDDLVIGNGVGNTLGYTRLLKAFTTAASVARVDDVSPHTCRHTFASILIDQGADVEFVSQQLGHVSTKTTWDIYVHLFRAREHADAARRDLDAAFGPMLRAATRRGSDD
jgi:integrase